MSLIDLKGGLEFQLFENLERIAVYSDPSKSVHCLTKLEQELDVRLKVFSANKCKDIAAYRTIPAEKRVQPQDQTVHLNFDRHIVVIDEAAEMFLSQSLSCVRNTQAARQAASKIARIGRALGIHLIIGTQRPDARALDTQVKANLTGKICFQMGDTASAMVVLNNARARDLPSIPGRAIWQTGMRQLEVQVPFLELSEAEKILHPKQNETGT